MQAVKRWISIHWRSPSPGPEKLRIGFLGVSEPEPVNRLLTPPPPPPPPPPSPLPNRAGLMKVVATYRNIPPLPSQPNRARADGNRTYVQELSAPHPTPRDWLVGNVSKRRMLLPTSPPKEPHINCRIWCFAGSFRPRHASNAHGEGSGQALKGGGTRSAGIGGEVNRPRPGGVFPGRQGPSFLGATAVCPGILRLPGSAKA
jgi:hypothetical protein